MLLRSKRTLFKVVLGNWRSNVVTVGLIVLASVAGEWLARGPTGVPSFLPLVLGTATAFFIGFINNQAYVRWWEARTVWGELVNDSRTWARSLVAYCPEDRARVRELVRRHIAFVWALNAALRRDGGKYFHGYLKADEVAAVEALANVPNGILALQTRELHALERAGAIDGFRFLGLARLLENFSNEMGKCERIRNTVFPLMYVYFTQLAVAAFVVANTLVMADLIGYWSILGGWLIGFLFEATFQSGMSLVDPFDRQPAAVSLDAISRTIEINLLQELGEPNIPAPIAAVNGTHIL